MTDETHERAEPLEVGFREDEPRIIHHQYELDRLYREYHSARDNEVQLRKGRAIVAVLMRWIRFGTEFEPDDLDEAKDAVEAGKVVVKTAVKTRSIGTPDEHYVVEWDSYNMAVRQGDLEGALGFVRVEALDVKLDAQAEVISTLLGICDRRKVLQRDYRVGLTPEEKMERGSERGY